MPLLEQVPQVVEAIAKAVSKGLSLPIVYNTSSYDSLASLKMIDGLVDIYLPDFKSVVAIRLLVGHLEFAWV